MPRYAHLTTFLAKALECSKDKTVSDGETFNEGYSSLYALTTKLRKDDTTASAVQQWITQYQQTKPNKYKKYKAALDYLRSTFPGMAGGLPVAPALPAVELKKATGPSTESKLPGNPRNVLPLPPRPATRAVQSAPPPAPKPKIGECLPDLGCPPAMKSSPATLIAAVTKELQDMTAWTVGDAIRFSGTPSAIEKEKVLRGDSKEPHKYPGSPQRLEPMHSAEQAAGGAIHYRQALLKSVYEHSKKAEAAVCTTFALAAAHVLTKGERQKGDVRVEIIGVDRNLGTHMYVVCGRQGNNLKDRKTWGPHAVIVDIWAAALANSKNFQSGIDEKTDWRINGGSLGQFYDNGRGDPSDSDLVRSVNVDARARAQKESELKRLEGELKDAAPWDKVKRQKLDADIKTLQSELKK